MWTTCAYHHNRTPCCNVMMSWNRKTLSPIQPCYSHANYYQMDSTVTVQDAGWKTICCLYQDVNYLAVLSYLITITTNARVIPL